MGNVGTVGNVFVVVCLTVAIPVDRRICCPCRCCNLQRPANTLRGCCTFVVLSCFCVVLGCCPILGNLEVVVVSGGGKWWVVGQCNGQTKQNRNSKSMVRTFGGADRHQQIGCFRRGIFHQCFGVCQQRGFSFGERQFLNVHQCFASFFIGCIVVSWQTKNKKDPRIKKK